MHAYDGRGWTASDRLYAYRAELSSQEEDGEGEASMGDHHPFTDVESSDGWPSESVASARSMSNTINTEALSDAYREAFTSNKWEKFISDALAHVRSHPSEFKWGKRLAVAYMYRGNPDSALREAHRILRLSPTENLGLELHRLLGRYLFEEGNRAEAHTHLMQAYMSGSEDAQALLYLAESLIDSGDGESLDKAQTVLLEVVDDAGTLSRGNASQPNSQVLASTSISGVSEQQKGRAYISLARSFALCCNRSLGLANSSYQQMVYYGRVAMRMCRLSNDVTGLLELFETVVCETVSSVTRPAGTAKESVTAFGDEIVNSIKDMLPPISSTTKEKRHAGTSRHLGASPTSQQRLNLFRQDPQLLVRCLLAVAQLSVSQDQVSLATLYLKEVERLSTGRGDNSRLSNGVITRRPLHMVEGYAAVDDLDSFAPNSSLQMFGGPIALSLTQSMTLHTGLSICYTSTGLKQFAADHANAALALAPNEPRLLNFTAACLIDAGSLTLAKDLLTRALAVQHVGHSQARGGVDVERVLRLLESPSNKVSTEPSETHLLMMLLTVNKRCDDQLQVLSCLQRLTAAQPSNVVFRIQHAEVMVRLGMWKDVQAELEALGRDHPFNPEVIEMLAESAAHRFDWVECEERCTELLTLPTAPSHLSLSLRELHAKAAYQVAVYRLQHMADQWIVSGASSVRTVMMVDGMLAQQSEIRRGGGTRRVGDSPGSQSEGSDGATLREVTGAVEKACELLDRVTHIDPRHAPALFCKGSLLYRYHFTSIGAISAIESGLSSCLSSWSGNSIKRGVENCSDNINSGRDRYAMMSSFTPTMKSTNSSWKNRQGGAHQSTTHTSESLVKWCRQIANGGVVGVMKQCLSRALTELRGMVSDDSDTTASKSKNGKKGPPQEDSGSSHQWASSRLIPSDKCTGMKYGLALMLAEVYFFENNLAMAAKYASQAARVRPTADALLLKSSVLLADLKLEEARSEAEAGLRAATSSHGQGSVVEAHTLIARIYERKNKLSDASRSITQASLLRPIGSCGVEGSALSYTMSLITFRQNSGDRCIEAIEDARRAVNSSPCWLFAHLHLGCVLLVSGEYEEAESRLTKACNEAEATVAQLVKLSTNRTYPETKSSMLTLTEDNTTRNVPPSCHAERVTLACTAGLAHINLAVLCYRVDSSSDTPSSLFGVIDTSPESWHYHISRARQLLPLLDSICIRTKSSRAPQSSLYNALLQNLKSCNELILHESLWHDLVVVVAHQVGLSHNSPQSSPSSQIGMSDSPSNFSNELLAKQRKHRLLKSTSIDSHTHSRLSTPSTADALPLVRRSTPHNINLDHQVRTSVVSCDAHVILHAAHPHTIVKPHKSDEFDTGTNGVMNHRTIESYYASPPPARQPQPKRDGEYSPPSQPKSVSTGKVKRSSAPPQTTATQSPQLSSSPVDDEYVSLLAPSKTSTNSSVHNTASFAQSSLPQSATSAHRFNIAFRRHHRHNSDAVSCLSADQVHRLQSARQLSRPLSRLGADQQDDDTTTGTLTQRQEGGEKREQRLLATSRPLFLANRYVVDEPTLRTGTHNRHNKSVDPDVVRVPHIAHIPLATSTHSSPTYKRQETSDARPHHTGSLTQRGHKHEAGSKPLISEVPQIPRSGQVQSGELAPRRRASQAKHPHRSLSSMSSNGARYFYGAGLSTRDNGSHDPIVLSSDSKRLANQSTPSPTSINKPLIRQPTSLNSPNRRTSNNNHASPSSAQPISAKPFPPSPINGPGPVPGVKVTPTSPTRGRSRVTPLTGNPGEGRSTTPTAGKGCRSKSPVTSDRSQLQPPKMAGGTGIIPRPLSGIERVMTSMKINISSDKLLRKKDLVLGQCLGKGGFGAVFAGTVRATGDRVAIKKLHLNPTSMSDKQWKELLCEIEVIQRLEHRYLVRFVGAVIQDPNFVCIVTELCSNGNLHSLLHGVPQRQIAFERRRVLAAQMLEAVVFLHSQTPKLDSQWNAKICDFGLTTAMETEKTHLSLKEGNNGGSPRYMAPECYDSKAKICEKVDIWALGCILIEVFGGPVPFHDCTEIQHIISRLIVHKQGPHIPSYFPPDLRLMLKGCLEFDIKVRWDATKILRHIKGLRAFEQRGRVR
eukprot:GHVN01066602.1.p1 GENE.GHVN01066602.1~~GHVN01066602.1.p1  ORF type:complete len:2107 (+),score=402.48 GHVN01066602.1:107-6427(+)